MRLEEKKNSRSMLIKVSHYLLVVTSHSELHFHVAKHMKNFFLDRFVLFISACCIKAHLVTIYSGISFTHGCSVFCLIFVQSLLQMKIIYK